jgi:hypothetical protein
MDRDAIMLADKAIEQAMTAAIGEVLYYADPELRALLINRFSSRIDSPYTSMLVFPTEQLPYTGIKPPTLDPA